MSHFFRTNKNTIMPLPSKVRCIFNYRQIFIFARPHDIDWPLSINTPPTQWTERAETAQRTYVCNNNTFFSFLETYHCDFWKKYSANMRRSFVNACLHFSLCYKNGQKQFFVFAWFFLKYFNVTCLPLFTPISLTNRIIS